jgi:hypothetical protein
VKQPQQYVGVYIARSHSNQETSTKLEDPGIQATTSRRKALRISIQFTEMLGSGSVTKNFRIGCLLNSVKQMAALDEAYNDDVKRGDDRELLGCSARDFQHAIPTFISATDILTSADDMIVNCLYKPGFPPSVDKPKDLVSAFKQIMNLPLVLLCTIDGNHVDFGDYGHGWQVHGVSGRQGARCDQ